MIASARKMAKKKYIIFSFLRSLSLSLLQIPRIRFSLDPEALSELLLCSPRISTRDLLRACFVRSVQHRLLCRYALPPTFTCGRYTKELFSFSEFQFSTIVASLPCGLLEHLNTHVERKRERERSTSTVVPGARGSSTTFRVFSTISNRFLITFRHFE